MGSDLNVTSVLEALACYLGLSRMCNSRESPRTCTCVDLHRNHLFQFFSLTPSPMAEGGFFSWLLLPERSGLSWNFCCHIMAAAQLRDWDLLSAQSHERKEKNMSIPPPSFPALRGPLSCFLCLESWDVY